MPPTHRPRRTAAVLHARFGDAPFAVREALAAGVSPGQLRAAVAGGHLRSVRHGVLSVGAVPAELHERHLEQVRAVLACIGAPAVVSHGSAALLLGLPYPSIAPPDDVPVELTGRAWEGRGSRDWVRHHADVDRDELVVRDGVRVTGLARTAVDVARSRSGPDAHRRRRGAESQRARRARRRRRCAASHDRALPRRGHEAVGRRAVAALGA